MFDYNKMIKRAVQFFPTWSDIRKRYSTSAGGKLIGAITEEVVSIEDAIKEYKKYYFLDNYEGHEDDVMAFSYKFAIGNVDVNTIKVKHDGKYISVTEDINKLVDYSLVAYYELGNIYVNNTIDPNVIEIYVGDDRINAEYDLVSVWNIFDEFACFVGLERHEGELNSQLVKRILHITRYKPNASVEGLQNAIMAELLSECPDLTRDEIQIERADETNLRQAYKNFNTLLDFLNSINCDVYRWKRWDLNVWQHDFKSISYIPAKWDESVSNFTNGIGYGDDCQVIMASNKKDTDAVITLYDKSTETMNKYLSNKKIEKDINIKFKRYNDILQYNNVNYTIKASPLTAIDPEKVILDVYQEVNTMSDVPVEQLYMHGHNIEVNNSNSIINDAYPYRLKFEAKDNGQEVNIKRCIVYYTDKVTGELVREVDLLREKTGFTINSLGHLVSNSIKRNITRVEDFDAGTATFFSNMPNNLGFKATAATSTAIKTLYNLGGQQITYSASCDLSDIKASSRLISFDSADCRWDKNNVIFHSVNRLKKVQVKLTANKFTFDVLTNNTVDVMVRYGTEGQYEVIDKAQFGTTWSTKEFDSPRYMEIVITSRAEEEIKIGNFKYCNYSVEFYFKLKDQYVKMTGTTLPVSNTINLKVVVNSKSGSTPIIKGIHIGTGLASTTYITDSFEPLTNCYREISVDSNCSMTLIKRDILDSSDSAYTENYDPSVSYRATDNDAYIRLNLNEYSSINNITTSVGRIQRVEESGAIFYNLALVTGQEVKRITIDGRKNETMYSVSLLDMVNRLLKDYTFNLTTDKLYCSALVKGVVVLKNNDEGEAEILPLPSSMFNGVESTKFVFSTIPNDIGVIWGSGDGYYSNSIVGSFDYITFYRESDKIHVANNTYNLFTNEIKDVPIAENFTDPEYYDKNNLNFYTVECNTHDIEVKFYNYIDVSTPFDELKKWSVGYKNLYIKNTCDYNNETIYDVSVLDYSSKEILAEYINLQDSYKISANNTIYTEHYIVVPPEGMNVQYKTYDATAETKNLLKTETISVDKTMFKKLQYSNIDKIMYIGKSPTTDNTESEDIKYTLLNKEGIIVWNDLLPEGTVIYLKYTIKKPVALTFDLDLLYKLTGYTVETYRELSTYYLIGMEDGSTYDLNNFNDFKDSDLAYIQCSEPSFQGQMINENIARFNKHAEEKTVLVKTGYYYFNGREYYLFSEDESKTLYNNKHMLTENVDVSDDYIYTYKATNNFVQNSEMLLRNINDLYNYDCNTPLNSPKFNKYTACDSYNDWVTFNTDLGLTDELYKLRIKTGDTTLEGFNDVALELAKRDSDTLNYAYLDITEYVSPSTYITLAATPGLKIYIGEERRIGDLKVKSSLSVSLLTELKAPLDESCIRTAIFSTKEDMRYYVVVCNEGIIDDIVISNDLSPISNYHVKNIEKLGLMFNEVKTQGTMYKMKLDNLYSSINNNATICSDGYIRTVGNISWNATKIKTYNTREDFTNRNCYFDTELIVNNYIKAPNNSSGRFITEYIQIDPSVINRLFVKVNDILIDSMDKFKITILSTKDKRSSDVEILTLNDNCAFVYGYDLYKFVKVKIEIPEGCVIDKIEILAEYKSDKDNAPVLVTPNAGELISPVFDSQQSSIYTVKNININDISNINDVDIYVRTMTEGNTSYIWSKWNKLELKIENGKAVFDNINTESLSFKYTPVRFFQFKIVLKSKDAYIDFDSLDIEVKE